MRKRAARKYIANSTGYGFTADAYHMTAPPPDGEGAVRAMQMALDRAHITPEKVDYVNAHATSTGLEMSARPAPSKPFSAIRA